MKNKKKMKKLSKKDLKKIKGGVRKLERLKPRDFEGFELPKYKIKTVE
jgi:bacteriocin-like protein